MYTDMCGHVCRHVVRHVYVDPLLLLSAVMAAEANGLHERIEVALCRHNKGL